MKIITYRNLALEEVLLFRIWKFDNNISTPLKLSPLCNTAILELQIIALEKKIMQDCSK